MHIKSAEFKKGIRGTDDILYEPKLQVAFIGRSNVGKSSLMNCLLDQKELVKTGKTPGKTKEMNFFLINKSFYFVDLPGYGYAKLDQETREHLAQMIQWYFFEKVFKRRVVLVLDVKAGATNLDLEMLRLLRDYNQDVLVVANKIDVLNQRERHEQLKTIAEKIPDFEIIACSATTREGKADIMKKIFQ